ncbi:hypothetical protein DFH27DRAFT_605697 [Peziza echinospora]|nr:hypothetical protein DFH27DRAFT_605697 [Peziza echinospora]
MSLMMLGLSLIVPSRPAFQEPCPHATSNPTPPPPLHASTTTTTTTASTTHRKPSPTRDQRLQHPSLARPAIALGGAPRSPRTHRSRGPRFLPWTVLAVAKRLVRDRLLTPVADFDHPSAGFEHPDTLILALLPGITTRAQCLLGKLDEIIRKPTQRPLNRSPLLIHVPVTSTAGHPTSPKDTEW